MRITQLLTVLTATMLLSGTLALPVAAQHEAQIAGTEWELQLLDGEPLPGDAEISLRFNDERTTGQAPVNRYFGGYERVGEALTFSDVVSTRIGGPPHLMEIESIYFEILRAVSTHRMVDDRLELCDHTGATRLVFAPADPTPELAGTEWQLKLLDGEPLPDDAEVTANFTDDQILGYAPVNQYFASYEVEEDAMSFSEIGRTLMAGPDHLMEAENAFMAALEETRSLRVMEGRLELIDEAGETRALFGLARESMEDLEIIDPGAHLDLAESQLWVPMRPIAEWLGATVRWDAETRTATAVRDGKQFSVDTLRNVGRGGGLEWTTSYEMLRPSGMVYAPLDALTHSLGGRVIHQPDDHVLILEIGDRRGTLTAP